MPTYEYQCLDCETVFDVFQSIKASPLRKAVCDRCGDKRRVKRLIGTGGAVIFKGSGFYQTDYRSDAYSKAAKAETDSGKSDEKKSTDSKKETSASASDKSSTESKQSSQKSDSPRSPSS